MIRDMETNRKRWVTVELRKSRAKRVIDVYVKMILSGQTDLKRLAQMYRPDSLNPFATLKRFLKQKEVIKTINEKMDEDLKVHGIDWNFTIIERKKLFESAMQKKDFSTALKVLNSFEDKLLNLKYY